MTVPGTVEGWDRGAVRVTGEIGRNVEELIVERNGDSVTTTVLFTFPIKEV